jgi:hypothetical protein
MKQILLIAILSSFALSLPAQAISQSEDKSTVLVADKYYWPGPEGNLGVEITGKFQSEQKLEETLNLFNEIGSFKDLNYPSEKVWRLRDILVLEDFNATGSVAKWQVCGPKPLILEYLKSLKRKDEDQSLFYDFGYRLINFKPSTD